VWTEPSLFIIYVLKSGAIAIYITRPQVRRSLTETKRLVLFLLGGLGTLPLAAPGLLAPQDRAGTTQGDILQVNAVLVLVAEALDRGKRLSRVLGQRNTGDALNRLGLVGTLAIDQVDTFSGGMGFHGQGLLLDLAGEAKVGDTLRIHRIGGETLPDSLANEGSIVVSTCDEPKKVSRHVDAVNHCV